MADSIRLSSVAINRPNAAELAAFYADITGGRVTFAGPGWATVKGPGGRIDFQTVADHTPPTWPEATSPVQMHLDFLTRTTAPCSPTPPGTRSAEHLGRRVGHGPSTAGR
jgi:hypothetical protein